ncbi:MAG TPA: hypothetical protein VH592_14110 [Gemmataceae bacterium]|jgi:hypothetical protein
MYRYHFPLDPDCPVVRDWQDAFYNDPMTTACGCADEIAGDWETRHRRTCKRCQEYGCANVEVVD